MATFESRLTGNLFSARNKLIANRQAKLNGVALSQAAEDELEEALNKSNILSGNAKKVASLSFGNRLSTNLNINKNGDWKQVVQYVTYLLAKKRQVKNYKETYDIIRTILKLNSNRGGRILNPEARKQFLGFFNSASKVYMNTNLDIKEAYVEKYIEIRADILKTQAPANLSRISNGAFRRPTQAESSAVLKTINKTSNNNLKYQRLKNINLLRPANRGLAARGFASSNFNKWKRASTQARLNFNRKITNINRTKNLLSSQMSEINSLLSWLSTWSTNALQPGSITNSNKKEIIATVTKALSKVKSELQIVSNRGPPVKLSRSAKEEAERRAAEEIARFAPAPAPPVNFNNYPPGFHPAKRLRT
jgi:hypothetical protein